MEKTENPIKGDTPKTPKRVLFYQEQQPSQSPTKKLYEEKIHLSGYITDVYEKTKSEKTGNSYFDLKMKISPKDNVTIRVMKRTNATLSREAFLSQIGKGVMLSNLSKSNSSFLFFFNQYYGSTFVGVNNLRFKPTDVVYDEIGHIKTTENESKLFNVRGCIRWISESSLTSPSKSPSKRLREAVIMDETGFMPLTVWENQISQLQEDVCFAITDVKVKAYFQSKLVATQTSKITLCEEFNTENLDWTVVQMTDFAKIEASGKAYNNPTWCCPNITSANVIIFPTCNNPNCRRKIDIPGEMKFVRCTNCSHKSLVKKLPMSLSIEFDIRRSDTNETVSLTALPDALNNYFGTDVVAKYAYNENGKDELEEKILELEDVDITFSKARCIVKEIKGHAEEDNLI